MVKGSIPEDCGYQARQQQHYLKIAPALCIVWREYAMFSLKNIKQFFFLTRWGRIAEKGNRDSRLALDCIRTLGVAR